MKLSILPFLLLLVASNAMAAPGALPPPRASVGDLVARLDARQIQGQLSARNANYAIDVSLSTEDHTLTGHEVIRYRNLTNGPMRDVWLHLYLNAFKNMKSTFMAESGGQLRRDKMEKEGFGYIDIEEARLVPGGGDLSHSLAFESPDDGNQDDRTVVRLCLPKPVPPGGEIAMEIRFKAKLPKLFARTGYVGSFHMVGQWFPKVGVFEQRGDYEPPSWNCHQFHANSEFFSDYGIYDVRIFAPTGVVIGACGERLSAPTKASAGYRLHHYRAEDVHDFSFTADKDFWEKRERWRHVTIKLLYQPEHESLVDLHMRAARRGLEFFTVNYGDYPYRTLTMVDPGPGGSGAAGMEYPTLITVGSLVHHLVKQWFPWFVSFRMTEVTLLHEFGHEYWYGMVGSNEFEEAWLDEGINSYSESLVVEGPILEMLGGLLQMSDLGLQRTGYLSLPHEGAILSRAWDYPSGAGYGVGSYMKPATVLRTLQNIVGDETMQTIMQTYFERWRFRHPRSEDFFEVVNDVTGDDFGPYFDQFVRRDLAIDYTIRRLVSRKLERKPGFYDIDGKRTEITEDQIKKERKDEKGQDGKKDDASARYRTEVTLCRKAEGILPVDYEVRFEDGTKVTGTWDGKARCQKREFESASKAVVAVVDPDHKLLLDLNFNNNARFATGGTKGRHHATAKSKLAKEARARSDRFGEVLAVLALTVSHLYTLLLY